MMKKGKKVYVFFVTFIMLLAGTAPAQDNSITINTATLGAVTNAGEVNFAKSFTINFTNNTVDPNATITVMDESSEMAVLKKGISAAEKNSFTIAFTAANGNYTVNGPNGTVTIPLVDFIQLFYTIGTATKEIDINKKKTDDGGNGNGTGNGGGNANPANANPVAGIEIHDAILARKYYDNDDPALFKLLAAIKGSSLRDPDSILALYAGNRFIQGLLADEKVQRIRNKTSATASQGGLFGGLGDKLLNTDVTTLADGFARFLVKRAKEELSVAFFRRFKELINEDQYKDARILFPNTLQTLNVIDEQIYQFENYITTLREAFEKDLSLLLDNIPEVIEEGRFSGYFSGKPNLKYSLLLALFTARELVNGTHPGKVLETIPDEYVTGFVDHNGNPEENVSGAFHTAQLLSASLRSRGTAKYWTTGDSIQMLYRNDKALVAARFYLGFLYEKSGNIDFDKKTLQTYLGDIARIADTLTRNTAIKQYIAYVKKVGEQYHNIEAAIAQVKQKDGTPSADVYYRLFNSFADAFDEILKIDALPGINIDGKVGPEIKKYLAVYKQCNDLALNVARKEYGSAIVNVHNIYLFATGKREQPTNETVTDNAALFTAAPAGGDATTEQATNTANSIAASVAAFIKKYGNFMANVVKAKTSEEVAAAIEAAALPVGSASVKRHSNWNIALNAYVGPYLGRERIKNVDSAGTFKPNTGGLTAPIGFSISKGIGWDRKNGWSVSLFLSVIDLGAPVAFRFKDSVTEQIPTIQLKDIISPGAFLSIGFPQVPISCNVGWQSGPLLRKLDPSVASIAGSTYSRFSVSFVVDIPLLNFYTQRKRADK